MEPEQKSNGALVGLIIIVLILLVGGIYIWKNSTKAKSTLPSSNDVGVNADLETTPIDDTAGIEADVNSIDLDSLDQGL